MPAKKKPAPEPQVEKEPLAAEKETVSRFHVSKELWEKLIEKVDQQAATHKEELERLRLDYLGRLQSLSEELTDLQASFNGHKVAFAELSADVKGNTDNLSELAPSVQNNFSKVEALSGNLDALSTRLSGVYERIAALEGLHTGDGSESPVYGIATQIPGLPGIQIVGTGTVAQIEEMATKERKTFYAINAYNPAPVGVATE